MLLLVVGFFTHFLGSSLQIHAWYCNNGEACVKTLSQDQNYEANTVYLIRYSLLEAFLFLVIGIILKLFKLTNSVLFLTTGIILHIALEKMLVHKYFCKITCDIAK
jgi:hypothetical protein